MALGDQVCGFCPMGCGTTLFVGVGGHITCSYVGCPEPSATDLILDDRITEHVVTFDDDGFTIRHPLRERINDELMRCTLHNECARAGPPLTGVYTVFRVGDRWQFQMRR